MVLIPAILPPPPPPEALMVTAPVEPEIVTFVPAIIEVTIPERPMPFPVGVRTPVRFAPDPTKLVAVTTPTTDTPVPTSDDAVTMPVVLID